MSFLVDVFFNDYSSTDTGSAHDHYGPFQKAASAQKYADSIMLRIELASQLTDTRSVTATVRQIHHPQIMPVVHEARAFLHGEHTPKEET